MTTESDIRKIKAAGVKQNYFYHTNVDEGLIDSFPTRTVLRVAYKKLTRALLKRIGRESVAPRLRSFNGVTVFGNELLDGEGTTVGQDFPRVLNEMGINRVENLFEFCAGPGYIGFMLLANGYCKNLTLADINPEAVQAQFRTIEYNGLGCLVSTYVSDVFSDIPETEKWDLVVSNPPHFLPRWEGEVPVDPRDEVAMAKVTNHFEQASRLKARDPDWSIHRRFYAGIKNHMKQGGLVVMQENSKPFNNGMAQEDEFVDMITSHKWWDWKRIKVIPIIIKRTLSLKTRW